MSTLKTYLEDLQLACNSKACAPPPVGTGGSNDSGGGGAGGQSAAGRAQAIRNSITTADDEVDTDAVRKAKMVAQARAEASGEGWRPNVSRSDPGAAHVAADAGEVMAGITARAKIDPETGEDGLPPKAHGEDQLLSAIYEARGFNKQAELLSSEDFEQFLQDNAGEYLEGWRGIDTGSDPSVRGGVGEEIAMAFHESEVHWVGRGILGNGTYFATNHPDSQEGFARSVDESSRYSNRQNVVQVHAAIDTYNMATYEHIQNIGTVIHRLTNGMNPVPPADQRDFTPAELHAHGANSRMADRWLSMTTKEVAMGMEVVRQGLEAGMTVGEIHTMTKDAGRLSAIIGYDGLSTKTDPGPGQTEYTVVHNRGSVKLDYGIYTTKLKDPTNRYPTHLDRLPPELHPTWNDESQRSR